MPFTYTIAAHERVAYVTAQGAVDLRSVMEAIGEIRKDPSFEPDFGVIIDAREMEYAPTMGEIGVLAWALGHERANLGSKVAVVRPPSRLPAARTLYSTLAATTGISLDVFANPEAALQWVGAT